MKYLLFVFSVLISACAPQTGHEALEAAAPEVKSSGDSISGHVKMGANVRLSDIAPLPIRIAKTNLVNLMLIAGVAEGVMAVQISTSAGLQLLSAQDEFQFELTDTAAYQIPLELRAETEGRYYVNIHVQTLVQGYKSSRVLAAIIEAGSGEQLASEAVQSSGSVQFIGVTQSGGAVHTSGAMRSAPSRKQTSSSDAPIILPAQETIITQ